jgi:hypothetical protein
MRAVALTILLPLAFASPLRPSPITTADEADSTLAPLNAADGAQHIEDSYIVVLRKDIEPEQMALHLNVVDQWHGLDVSATSLLSMAVIRPPSFVMA